MIRGSPMTDIDWKALPEGLWTPPAVFADVGNLCLQAFTDDGVPTWEICKRKESGANGTSSRKVLPTPSRRPKRRRSSKRKQHRGCHDVGVTGVSDARRDTESSSISVGEAGAA